MNHHLAQPLDGLDTFFAFSVTFDEKEEKSIKNPENTHFLGVYQHLCATAKCWQTPLHWLTSWG